MKQHNWRARLDALMIERFAEPFAFGTNDCCIFAADAVLAQTGEDFAKDLRGTYSDKAGALAVIDYYTSISRIATDALGAALPPLMAQIGDVVLIDAEEGESLAVCVGREAVVPGATGLVFVPMEKWLSCWRVQ